jgi:hypothetical protein
MQHGNCVASMEENWKRIQSDYKYYPIDDSSLLLVEQPMLLCRRALAPGFQGSSEARSGTNQKRKDDSAGWMQPENEVAQQQSNQESNSNS